MWCAHSFLRDEARPLHIFRACSWQRRWTPSYISFMSAMHVRYVALSYCENIYLICCWQKSTCRTFQVYRGTCSTDGSGDRNSRICLCDEWEKTRISYGEYFPITSLSKISNRSEHSKHSTFLSKLCRGTRLFICTLISSPWRISLVRDIFKMSWHRLDTWSDARATALSWRQKESSTAKEKQ